MKQKNIKISDSAKAELRSATIDKNKLTLQPNIKNYAELKKIFAEIDIVWNKKDKIHYLGQNSKEMIDFILNGGQIVDEKKTFQFYPTPQKLARKLVEMADIKETDFCLEPSCGTGNILKEIVPYSKNVHCFEINESCFDEAVKIKGIVFAICCDFLTEKPTKFYDKILMNPPFDNNLWMDHLEHAYEFLNESGEMYVICPNAQHNRFFQDFIKDKVYEIEEIDSGAFKESGTMISTMIVTIRK